MLMRASIFAEARGGVKLHLCRVGEDQILSLSNSGRGLGITTLFTSIPFRPTMSAAALTAASTAATLPVSVTNALPPSAIARRISMSSTFAAFTAASAPSIRLATENDSTIPSASSISTLVTPLIAGNTASCRFGITNESITEKRVPATPAATAASTAATSPRTIRVRLRAIDRGLALVVLRLQPLAQLRERHAPVLLHRMDFHRRLLHEFEPCGAAVLLAGVARFFRIQVLGTCVQRAQPARAA